MLLTMHTAAKEYGISKPTLYFQKDQVPMPVYIVKIKVPGGKDVFKIDTENPMWEAYVHDYKIRKGFDKLDQRQLKNLVNATVDTIKEVFSPTEDRLKEILNSINEKFQTYEGR